MIQTLNGLTQKMLNDEHFSYTLRKIYFFKEEKHFQSIKYFSPCHRCYVNTLGKMFYFSKLYSFSKEIALQILRWAISLKMASAMTRNAKS